MTNKERLSDLEAGLGMMQDEFQKLTVGIDDRIRGIESSFQRTLKETLGRMREMVTNSREGGFNAPRQSREPDIRPQTTPQEEMVNPFAPVRHNPHRVKLEFLKFSGGDPTEWISKAKQYFAYHEMPLEKRVSFASYHLTDEANEWWQAISKARGTDPSQVHGRRLRRSCGPGLVQWTAKTSTKRFRIYAKKDHCWSTRESLNDSRTRWKAGWRKLWLVHSWDVSTPTSPMLYAYSSPKP